MIPPNITPGPWRQASTAQADEYTTRILAGQGTRSFRVAETFAHPDADNFDEAEANARAIAALPALLRKLELIHANAAESPEWIRRHTEEALTLAGYTF
jgi:hypothetical protein